MRTGDISAASQIAQIFKDSFLSSSVLQICNFSTALKDGSFFAWYFVNSAAIVINDGREVI